MWDWKNNIGLEGGMSVLYIKEQGSCIQKRSERLIVAKGSRSLLEIPAANVENVAVFGNVQITAQALHMLLEQGINVTTAEQLSA